MHIQKESQSEWDTFERVNELNLTVKVHLNDLFKLQDIYHYDLMYFNYEFDSANFYISGFE